MNKTVQNNNYGLSIRFSSDGFSLFITDENHNTISKKTISSNIFHLNETEIIDLFSKEPELQLNYKTVRLICETNTYTIIPYLFFKKEQITEMLKFQHPEMQKSDVVLSNFLEAWDAVNIFSIPKPLSAVLQQFLPEITIEHHITTFLTDYIAMLNEKSVHIWIRTNEMDVVVLNGNNLQLINCFDYNTAEDFTYHTINTIQQLGFNPDECKVFLYNSEKGHEYNQLIGKFVKDCQTKA